MRLTLKHQIIIAPAAVLLLFSLLLGFLQYTYWDLSNKRQQARDLGAAFIALAEANLVSQRLHGLSLRLQREHFIDIKDLEEMTQLHHHLDEAMGRIFLLMDLEPGTHLLLEQSVSDLNPENGLDSTQFLAALASLRPQLVSLIETARFERDQLRNAQARDIDDLVAHTARVSLTILAAAIVVGVFLSLFFARRILNRISKLTADAGRIAAGDLTPPDHPEQINDELDDLTCSISQMTVKLIRVVGAEKLLEGAEEERRRIAMDLHDQTLSDMSGILRGLQEIQELAPPGDEISGRSEKLENDLRRTISNLREVMDDLHPQTLEILGLIATLESHLETHRNGKGFPEYHLHVARTFDESRLTRPQKLALYRITVEAIQNVIKHAAAERYEISIDTRNGDMVLAVEDNGRGLRDTDPRRPGGRGLNNISERAHAIGARVSWQASRFTTGTRFELTLPLPAQAPASRTEQGE